MLDVLSKGETVGERIAYYRKKKKLSQQQLADLANISTCTIKRIENNKIDSSINTYNKIIEVLQVNTQLIYDSYLQFINSDYSNLIKSLRHQRRLTQKQFSKLLHVHIKTIMRWEQREQIPSREHYMLIKKLY